MSFNASVNAYSVNGDMVNAPAQAGVTVVVDTAAIAAAVWASPVAIALLTHAAETWGRMGLDAANPLLTNQTSVTFGTVSMALTGDQTSSTLTRQ